MLNLSAILYFIVIMAAAIGMIILLNERESLATFVMVWTAAMSVMLMVIRLCIK